MTTAPFWIATALAIAATSCGGPRGGAPVPAPKAAQPAGQPDRKPGKARPGKAKRDDPLFPTRETGWKPLDREARPAVRTFAADYLRFLGVAGTPRRAVAALTDWARSAGAVERGELDEVAAGGSYFTVAPGGTAAVFFRPGARPITDGLRIVVVSVDAPRIVLKQTPIDEHHGFAMLQTKLHGDIDLASWMVHPLALYVYVDRGGNKKPVDVAIGAAPDEPALSIPDLLPHLAGRVQRRDRPVSDPERLDALAGRTRAAVVAALAAKGIEAGELAAAEAFLIPATPAGFVGVDRAMIGGYGQSHRAMAFAAVRGLIDAAPDRAIAVIAVDQTEAGGGGSTGDAFVRRAVNQIIAALAPEADVYDNQRATSRTIALIAADSDKGRDRGVVINPRGADSMPASVAAVRRALDAGKVQYSINSRRSSSPGSDLASLDLDAVDASIAVTGAGTPGELVSILDLYQGYLACRAWLSSR